MDTQRAMPYFEVILGSVQYVASSVLSRNSEMDDYKTRLNSYAKIHTSIFRRMNDFWLWVVDDLLKGNLRDTGHEELYNCAAMLGNLLMDHCEDTEQWMRAEDHIEAILIQAPPLTGLNFGIIIPSLENSGNLGAAAELRQIMAGSLIAAAFSNISAAMRIAVRSAEVTFNNKIGRASALAQTCNSTLAAISAVIYLAAPESITWEESGARRRAPVLTDISSKTSMTVRCTQILDQLCSLELLCRVP